jgi:uncharacterized protein
VVVGAARFDAQNTASRARFTAAAQQRGRANDARDWRTIISARVRFMPAFHRQFSVFPYGTFTLILLGLIGFRLGIFDQPERHRRLIVGLMIAGCVSWAIVWWVLPLGTMPRPQPDDSVADVAYVIFRSNGFRLVRSEWLAFTYIGAVLLLVANNARWLERLSLFAWAGRMALTNYMTQVILLDTLFTAHGANLTVNPLLGPLYAFALFTVMALWSRWWLARYRFGPLEWIWRSVTYWRVQPLRRDAPVAQPVAVAA